MKQFRSLTRAVKRGHVRGFLNGLTNTIELYRRTSTSRKHTVFITQISLNRFNGDGQI